MRNPPNETLELSDSEDAKVRTEHVPERTCILTREQAPRAALIRLALGPDGAVAPDIRARAPGRGAWIGGDGFQGVQP